LQNAHDILGFLLIASREYCVVRSVLFRFSGREKDGARSSLELAGVDSRPLCKPFRIVRAPAAWDSSARCKTRKPICCDREVMTSLDLSPLRSQPISKGALRTRALAVRLLILPGDLLCLMRLICSLFYCRNANTRDVDLDQCLAVVACTARLAGAPNGVRGP